MDNKLSSVQNNFNRHDHLVNYADELEHKSNLRLSQINTHYGHSTAGASSQHVKLPISKSKKKLVLKFLPVLLVIAGVGLFLYKVATPIVVTKLDENSRQVIIKPIENEDEVEIVKNSSKNFSFDELYATANSENQKVASFENLPEYFYITIPKLKIEKAWVKTNSIDLNPQNALGHYRGSCLPGDVCNTYIYGHSTFKSVPNKYDKGDYSAVFSRLNELEFGDEFVVNYNNTDYRYLVNTLRIDKPENINPLSEPFGKGSTLSTLTLLTCDPPGTIKNRLEVIGVLVR